MPEENKPITNGSVAYDLNSANSWDAVRKLRGYEVELPQEPEVQAPQVTVVKARHSISLFAVISYIAVTALMILVIFSYMRLYEISAETSAYKSELTRLTKANAALTSEYDDAINLGAVELLAITKLGMRRPSSSQIVYVNLSEPDRAEVFEQQTAVSRLSGIIQTVKDCALYVREYFR